VDDCRIPLNWWVVIWLTVIHVGALAAPFFFTWQGLVALVALHWLTGGVGVCLGFHRLLTHGSFQTYRPIRWLLAFLGGLAGEGAAIDWVASHRQHHARSDQEGDPHSPRDGGWWSHMLWLGRSTFGQEWSGAARRWAPDLTRDRVMRILGHIAIPVHFLFGGLLFLAGYLTSGAYLGWSLVVWGMFLRLALVLHSTWLVNSASHMWGYRNYSTGDNSRNNWWVALLTYGEGWHNNHHAYPRMANHGHRWWEIDLTFRTIRLLERLGLAWNVVDYKARSGGG
jgi:stearoyl-CoA desaturase (delta-9 desaturase)